MFAAVSLAYVYDGSYNGFLCCVFESFLKKETPAAILAEGSQPSLYRERRIETDEEKARRVDVSLPKKISIEGAALIREGFLTCAPEKESLLLRFLQKGFAQGKSVVYQLVDDDVDALIKAVRFLRNEAHLSKEFLRFSDYGGTLVAELDPKNQVLPLMAEHFSSRFPNESFIIYDRTHSMALLHRPGATVLTPLEGFTTPPPGAQERAYRAMWKRFYDTVAIEGRENARCRMTLMPRHYWHNMPEFTDLPPSDDVSAALALQNHKKSDIITLHK